MVNTVKVPPDGGYGWIIVLANAVCNLMIIPIIQSFGLIFKDTFNEIGLSATEGSIIINLNASFGMILGLVNGVLIKVYGYRKMAFVGSFMVSLGIALTAYAKSFLHFIIAYGLITSLGMALSMSAYSLALNTYFRKRKGKAIGYAMTITGLGPILMPQLITVLTKHYTVEGATLIIAGISSHSFIAASFLHPVKWHMKKIEVDEEKHEEKKEQIKEEEEEENADTLPVYGMDSAFSGSVMSLQSITISRKNSVVFQRQRSVVSSKSSEKLNIYNPEMTKPKDKETSFLKKLFQRLVSFFDLDLLKDPIYVNIMMGMSLAVFAELNFSVLTAFILADFGLTTEQSATFMSVLGIVDIIFRFISPYIGDYFHSSPRFMYVLSLCMLMLTRSSLLLSNDYGVMLACAAGLGLAKGFRTVYMSLVIPTYVPLEKLASASGIQMMVNGICVMIGGPIIGVVRDITGSYRWCIVIINCVTFTTICMWTGEYFIRKCLPKKQTEIELQEQTNTLLNSK